MNSTSPAVELTCDQPCHFIPFSGNFQETSCTYSMEKLRLVQCPSHGALSIDWSYYIFRGEFVNCNFILVLLGCGVWSMNNESKFLDIPLKIVTISKYVTLTELFLRDIYIPRVSMAMKVSRMIRCCYSTLLSNVYFNCIVQNSLYSNMDIGTISHYALVISTPSPSIKLVLGVRCSGNECHDVFLLLIPC